MSLNPGVQQYCETKTGIHVTKPDGTVKSNQQVNYTGCNDSCGIWSHCR